MKAVIMAGGLGERLKPLTRIIPKPLLPVGNQSVLEIQLLNLKTHGVGEIYLALGYKHDLFDAYFGDGTKWNVQINYSIEKKPLGTAGPLSLLRDFLNEPFLVMNGDILTNLNFTNLAKAHENSGAAITVVTKVITLPLQYGVIKHENNRILSIEEKPSLSSEINAGIYFMSPEVLGRIPSDKFYSMDVFLKEIISDGLPVNRYPMTELEHWLDIGHLGEYEKAEGMFPEKSIKNLQACLNDLEKCESDLRVAHGKPN